MLTVHISFQFFFVQYPYASLMVHLILQWYIEGRIFFNVILLFFHQIQFSLSFASSGLFLEG